MIMMMMALFINGAFYQADLVETGFADVKSCHTQVKLIAQQDGADIVWNSKGWYEVDPHDGTKIHVKCERIS